MIIDGATASLFVRNEKGVFEKDDKTNKYILKPNIKQALDETGSTIIDGAVSDFFEKEDGKLKIVDGKRVLKADIQKFLNDTSNELLFDKLKETYIIPGNGPVYNPKIKAQPPSSQQPNDDNDTNKKK
jgi:hypothetical protein